MDTWGFLLAGIGAVLWLFTRKRSNKWASFATLLFGVGVGIIVGAVGSYLLITSNLF